MKSFMIMTAVYVASQLNYGWTSELLNEIFTPNSLHNVSIAQLIYSIKTKYINIVISITM